MVAMKVPSPFAVIDTSPVPSFKVGLKPSAAKNAAIVEGLALPDDASDHLDVLAGRAVVGAGRSPRRARTS
jgi:hypothetical protein